jgi:hypothetical protein
MAVAVFINVVLRYGFGSGIPASEELSRLLFVWMVFIGAAAAYPAGEHMAFTSLAGLLARKPLAFAAHGRDPAAAGRLRHAGLGRLAAGGGGLDSHSVVLGYPGPAAAAGLAVSLAIGLMALVELMREPRWTSVTAQKWSDAMSPEAWPLLFFARHAGADGHGMNMALALVLTGAGMAWVLDFWDTQLLAQNLVAGVDSFPLLAVPFFILAGELMNSGGISRRIIDMAQAWVGHIRAAWAMWPSARRCCWPA